MGPRADIALAARQQNFTEGGPGDTSHHLHRLLLVKELFEDWTLPFFPFFLYIGRSQTIPIPFHCQSDSFRLPIQIISIGDPADSPCDSQSSQGHSYSYSIISSNKTAVLSALPKKTKVVKV